MDDKYQRVLICLSFRPACISLMHRFLLWLAGLLMLVVLGCARPKATQPTPLGGPPLPHPSDEAWTAHMPSQMALPTETVLSTLR